MALNPEEGRFFTPKDFHNEGVVGGFNLYRAPVDFAVVMGDEDDVIKAEWPGYTKVPDGEIVVSWGANPCIIVFLPQSSHILVPEIGHFPEFEEQDIEHLNIARGGLAGGGQELLQEHEQLLTSLGFTILWPKGHRVVFDLVVVRRALPDVPEGVYFAYAKE